MKVKEIKHRFCSRGEDRNERGRYFFDEKSEGDAGTSYELFEEEKVRHRSSNATSYCKFRVRFKNYRFMGYLIDLPKAPVVIVTANKGFIMCGYLDINTADKLGVAACTVRGVNSIEEILKKEVSEVSVEAKKLNIKKAVSGLKALIKMS